VKQTSARRTISARAAQPAPANIDCSFQGQPEAYELTGRRERDLSPYVGKLVQISGTLKEAKTRALPSGEQAPTGGFDPLKKDLRLFEVEGTTRRSRSRARWASGGYATGSGSKTGPAAQRFAVSRRIRPSLPSVIT
jgi:hypothetical protein